MRTPRKKSRYNSQYPSDVDYAHRFEEDYDGAEDNAYQWHLDHAQEKD